MVTYDYLIVGNSAAGISAIEAIRALDAQGTIGCVSPEEFAAYSTPMISYLLKGTTTLDKMPIRTEDFYTRNAVDCIFGSPVVELDPAAKTVTLERGERLGYGKVLFATGSVPSDPPVEGLEGNNVFTFLNLTDALAVQRHVASLREADPSAPVNAVVVGSGLIGTKACEGLSAICDSVTMLARSGSILRSIISPEVSPTVETVFSNHGVDVRLNTTATGAVVEDSHVTALVLSDGSTLPASLVITAAGVRPNSAVPAAAGAREERGLVCDECQRTSLDDVYAAGDVARSHDVLDGTDKVIALWPDAVDQGTVAGNAMASGDARYEGSFALNAIGFYEEVSILTSGMSNPRNSEGLDFKTRHEADVYTRFVSRDGKLVGFTLVNQPDGSGIYTALIRDGVPLNTLNAAMFERVPEMRDLPYNRRWPLMHKGLPVSMKGGQA